MLASLFTRLFTSAILATSSSEHSNKYSNHIFNAIHSSMRQWGSSLNHNGMSMFIATVPSGTRFYHGTLTDEPVQGLDWLAFEPEHAIFFARLFSSPRLPWDKPSPRLKRDFIQGEKQQVFESVDKPKKGCLHTYQTKHALRLLHLDGMSAAKSPGGTQDTQDHLLTSSLHLKDGAFFGERARAEHLCQRIIKEWDNRIDGVIRMETGFEMFLCSMKDHLEVVRITAVEPSDKSKKTPWHGPLPFLTDQDVMSYFQAVTARYHDIGGNRVQLQYDDFVSAYSFKDADLFADGKRLMPRLNETSKKVRQSIEEAVSRTIHSKEKSKGTAWQGITDLIVGRHAPRLAYALSPAIASNDDMIVHLEEMLQPYIDVLDRDAIQESNRCATEHIPPHWEGTTAGRAIMNVSREVCSTLTTLLHEQCVHPDLAAAQETIDKLMTWLNWSVWKECEGCSTDEICLLPMWPFGGESDWEHPSCVNAESLQHHMGYWKMDFSAPGQIDH